MKRTVDLQRLYNKEYYEHTAYRGYTRWYFRIYHFFKFFRAGFVCRFWLRARTVLDIGCADGMSLWVFRNVFGLRAYGIEVSQWAADHAVRSVRQYVTVGSIEDEFLKLPLATFDVVASFDTFEHLQPAMLEQTFTRIFSLTKTIFCSIYVLDEIAAFAQNLFGVTHLSHYAEHSSAWWLDFFAGMNAMATRVPLGRRGTFLVRAK